jgi:hypothetical protein
LNIFNLYFECDCVLRLVMSRRRLCDNQASGRMAALLCLCFFVAVTLASPAIQVPSYKYQTRYPASTTFLNQSPAPLTSRRPPTAAVRGGERFPKFPEFSFRRSALPQPAVETKAPSFNSLYTSGTASAGFASNFPGGFFIFGPNQFAGQQQQQQPPQYRAIIDYSRAHQQHQVQQTHQVQPPQPELYQAQQEQRPDERQLQREEPLPAEPLPSPAFFQARQLQRDIAQERRIDVEEEADYRDGDVAVGQDRRFFIPSHFRVYDAVPY